MRRSLRTRLHAVARSVYPAAKRLLSPYPGVLKHKTGPLSPKVTHVAYFVSRGNAGDILLPYVLEDLANTGLRRPIKWNAQHVHKVVTPKDVRRINRTRGLVIGGGGLFLKDTNPNDLSGWQWSCSIEALDAIKVPLVLFAVGYNRFRGQEEFAPLFKEHLTQTVSKALYVGLRNHGSVRRTREYLPDSLKEKVRFQPCMTTLLARLYPGIFARPVPKNERPHIAVNCAFDRVYLRLGERLAATLDELACVLKKLSKDAAISYYAHSVSDEHFLPFLDSRQVPYEHVKLYAMTSRQIIEAYRKPSLVVGMRGHAQLIPFGCQTPIFSLVSHDKMQWFLDDIGHPDWGVEMTSPTFAVEAEQGIAKALNQHEQRVDDISNAQDILWDVSMKNVNELQKAFGL